MSELPQIRICVPVAAATAAAFGSTVVKCATCGIECFLGHDIKTPLATNICLICAEIRRPGTIAQAMRLAKSGVRQTTMIFDRPIL